MVESSLHSPPSGGIRGNEIADWYLSWLDLELTITAKADLLNDVREIRAS